MIQQTVTRELKAIREEAFSQAFNSLGERCSKRCAGAILNDGIDKYFLFFCVWFLWPRFENLIVYRNKSETSAHINQTCYSA
jgi:hypothetical protein